MMKEGSASAPYARYTLSEVIAPHELDARALEAAGVPLPTSRATVLEDGIDWEELMWGPSYLRVRGAEYPIQRLLYVPYTVAA